MKYLSFHGGDVEECCLLACDAVWILLVVAKVVPSAMIISTLMMEEVCFSETSVLTRVTYQKTAFFNNNKINILLPPRI
jgi:hypothetical protein